MRCGVSLCLLWQGSSKNYLIAQEAFESAPSVGLPLPTLIPRGAHGFACDTTGRRQTTQQAMLLHVLYSQIQAQVHTTSITYSYRMRVAPEHKSLQSTWVRVSMGCGASASQAPNAHVCGLTGQIVPCRFGRQSELLLFRELAKFPTQNCSSFWRTTASRLACLLGWWGASLSEWVFLLVLRAVVRLVYANCLFAANGRDKAQRHCRSASG